MSKVVMPTVHGTGLYDKLNLSIHPINRVNIS